MLNIFAISDIRIDIFSLLCHTLRALELGCKLPTKQSAYMHPCAAAVPRVDDASLFMFHPVARIIQICLIVYTFQH